ncbi:MAG: hypothetical protein ACTHLO_17250 [Pseudolabrys sp.]
MSNRIVALPTAPAAPTVEPGKPAQRPLAGPVVPLTVTAPASEDLLGGAQATRVHGDAIASQVLVKGEAISPQRGRADDFAWPPGSALRVEPIAAPAAASAPAKKSESLAVPGAPAAAAIAPGATPSPAAAATPVLSIVAPEAEQSQAAAESKELSNPAEDAKHKPKMAREVETERRNAGPPAPRNVERSDNELFGRGGLFGIFR